MITVDEDSDSVSELATRLIELSALQQQQAFLQDANLLHARGLLSLLDVAAEWARRNPGLARRLAVACAAVAQDAGIEVVTPRAMYIRAQTHALSGEFEQALVLITGARDRYLALGQSLPALRTTLGLMHVLSESGRQTEAITAGLEVLETIGDDKRPEMMSLAGLVQQNMGMCYSQIGWYEKALAAYTAAEASFTALGMSHAVGDIHNNRGILLWEMGHGTEALAALESALDFRAAAGQTMLQAQTLSNIGSAHLLLGHYTECLAAFAQARDLFESLDALVDQHVLHLDTAGAYLALNLYPEAEAAYREADRRLQAAGAVLQRARALWGLGATLLAQAKLDEAEQVLATAVSILEATSGASTPLLPSIVLEQAAVHAARNEWEKARSTARRALDLVTGRDWLVPAIYCHLQLADLARDDFTQTEAHLLAAQQVGSSLRLPHLQYRLYQRLGRLRRLQGRDGEARAHLETAVAEVERLRGQLAQETIRAAFLHDKVFVYEELMQLYLSRGNEQGMQRAFTVAEHAKARTLLDSVSDVLGAGHSVASDDSPQAVRLASLQSDLNAIYNEMLDTSATASAAHRTALFARAAELESEISQLRLHVAAWQTTPDPWAAPRSFEAIQAQLPEQSTLLVYHIVDDDIYAFVLEHRRLQVKRMTARLSDVKMILRRLAAHLDRSRAAGAFTQNQFFALELSVRRVLQTLYHMLFAPLEPLLVGAAASSRIQRLTIVPHSFLHQAPFRAFFDGNRYLLDRFEISYAPSATIFQICQQRRPFSRDNALILGVADESIPAVVTEVGAVARQLPQSRVFTGDEATLSKLRTEPAAGNVLHLACHGFFRTDNPMFSALKLHDGWLTASDAMQLRLRDALVTLSACESGRSHGARGHEMLGLIHGFLGAGASTVVVSLWLAPDEATAKLMPYWYEQLGKVDVGPAAALRAAQLALRAEFPHPFFWAPFVAIGRR